MKNRLISHAPWAALLITVAIVFATLGGRWYCIALSVPCGVLGILHAWCVYRCSECDKRWDAE